LSDVVEVRKFALQMAMAPVLGDEDPFNICPNSIVEVAQIYEHFLATGENKPHNHGEETTQTDILNTIN